VLVVYSDVKDEACDRVSPRVVELSEAALPSVRHRWFACTALGRVLVLALFMGKERAFVVGGDDGEGATSGRRDDDDDDDDVEEEYDKDREEEEVEVDLLELDRGEAVGGEVETEGAFDDRSMFRWLVITVGSDRGCVLPCELAPCCVC
jgi:hypothetical protein